MEHIEIELESFDETTLFSDQEKVAINYINFEFEQSNKIRGAYRKITIFNDHQCYQSIKNKHQRKYRYRVDLSFLDPHPIRERKLAWNWLCGSIGLSLLSAFMVYQGWFSDSVTPSAFYEVALVGVISAMLISLLLCVHNSYDKIIFKSQHGRVKFIEILNRYPDKVSFRKFIMKFILQVKDVKSRKEFSQSKFLTRELQEIRRLKNEDVISEIEYESAKKAIFNHKSYQVSRSPNK